ncbi:outer membrane beta-barrel protein [Dyadobacter luticola]|uniref:PorT family protein n=1 Tax=Dyadobacter luticola TaxID=1979387 RepID=A0A5R9KVV7_9BACT|nr:outer membrane beta-barrel protein [Dyadobacter luticola]TLV00412.1 PorT family protein [Dyadobacter luticola]
MKPTSYTIILLTAFTLLGAKAFSQDKFALSASVTPFFTHAKATVDATVPNPDGSGTFVNQRLKSEASLKGFWVGLNGRYFFSEKWSASTGLWFGYSTDKGKASSGRSHNFSIPVLANFQPSMRKVSPYFSAGALWNFNTTSHVNIPDIGTVTFKSGKNNTSRVSPTIGVGAIYHAAPHLALIAQPTFSYAIPPSGIDSHVYQVGLNVQVMYSF